MNPFEEAARKWLKDNDWDYQKYNDHRPDRSAYDTLMKYEISDYLSDAYEAGAHFGFAEAVRMLRHKSFSETADGERNYMEGAWMRACADWLEKTVSEK